MTVTEISLNLKEPLEREKGFVHLYEEVFPVVAGFVSKQGGFLSDAQDIFQDALVIFYEKSVSGTMNVNLSDEAYLVGIAKHLWIRKFKTDYKLISLDQFEKDITLPDESVDTKTNNRLLHLLEITGKKCLDLLQAIYYEKQPLDMISKAFGFSGSHSASAQKYKCIQKMKDTVKQKSLQYGDFTE